MKCKHTKILKWKAVKNYGAIVNAGSEVQSGGKKWKSHKIVKCYRNMSTIKNLVWPKIGTVFGGKEWLPILSVHLYKYICYCIYHIYVDEY